MDEQNKPENPKNEPDIPWLDRFEKEREPEPPDIDFINRLQEPEGR